MQAHLQIGDASLPRLLPAPCTAGPGGRHWQQAMSEFLLSACAPCWLLCTASPAEANALFQPRQLRSALCDCRNCLPASSIPMEVHPGLHNQHLEYRSNPDAQSKPVALEARLATCMWQVSLPSASLHRSTQRLREDVLSQDESTVLHLLVQPTHLLKLFSSAGSRPPVHCRELWFLLSRCTLLAWGRLA